jgi:hypothetical protein
MSFPIHLHEVYRDNLILYIFKPQSAVTQLQATSLWLDLYKYPTTVENIVFDIAIMVYYVMRRLKR